MKILVQVFKSGLVDCLEIVCPYQRECANHTTAGDFRSEGGFTPDLFEEGGYFFCRTKSSTANPEIDYSNYPSEDKGQGALFFEDGHFLRKDLY